MRDPPPSVVRSAETVTAPVVEEMVKYPSVETEEPPTIRLYASGPEHKSLSVAVSEYALKPRGTLPRIGEENVLLEKVGLAVEWSLMLINTVDEVDRE